MERLTEREKEILGMLRNNPMISQEELAELMGVTRSAAAVHISNLIKKGHILGRGYVFNDKSPVFVAGPVFMEIDAFKTSRSEEQVDIKIGGKGYGIAGNLSSLGVPVSFVTVLGRDEWGKTVTENLREYGVDTKYLLSQREFPTPRRVILRSDSDVAKVVTDSRALDKLGSESLRSLTPAVKASRAVLLDAAMPLEMLQYFTCLAGENEIPACLFSAEGSFLQTGKPKGLPLFLAVISKLDAEKASGIKIRDLDDGLAAGEVTAGLGFESVVVVIPGQGVCCAGRREKITVPLPPGHSDDHHVSFEKLTANLTANILQGYDLRQNLRLALANSVYINAEDLK